jgi:hypothetical protein
MYRRRFVILTSAAVIQNEEDKLNRKQVILEAKEVRKRARVAGRATTVLPKKQKIEEVTNDETPTRIMAPRAATILPMLYNR